MPESAAICGLPGALSAMVRVAFRAPSAAAVKTTAIVQLSPATTLLPQVLVSVNSLLCGPVIVMELMVNAARPRLVRVTVSGEVEIPGI
jgi:hypothetical protein